MKKTMDIASKRACDLLTVLKVREDWMTFKEIRTELAGMPDWRLKQGPNRGAPPHRGQFDEWICIALRKLFDGGLIEDGCFPVSADSPAWDRKKHYRAILARPPAQVITLDEVRMRRFA
jgi:hypothetical protein